MTAETPGGASVAFECPLPPVALRSNNRARWGQRVKAKQEYSDEVYGAWIFRDRTSGPSAPPCWKAARVTYTWRHAGVAPDRQNLGANLKALTDILCMAPKSTQPNNTTYLGIVEDDKGIEPVYKLEKVARRVAECVHVLVERLEE